MPSQTLVAWLVALQLVLSAHGSELNRLITRLDTDGNNYLSCQEAREWMQTSQPDHYAIGECSSPSHYIPDILASTNESEPVLNGKHGIES